jgi:hypothetical protein
MAISRLTVIQSIKARPVINLTRIRLLAPTPTSTPKITNKKVATTATTTIQITLHLIRVSQPLRSSQRIEKTAAVKVVVEVKNLPEDVVVADEEMLGDEAREVEEEVVVAANTKLRTRNAVITSPRIIPLKTVPHLQWPPKTTQRQRKRS